MPIQLTFFFVIVQLTHYLARSCHTCSSRIVERSHAKPLLPAQARAISKEFQPRVNLLTPSSRAPERQVGRPRQSVAPISSLRMCFTLNAPPPPYKLASRFGAPSSPMSSLSLLDVPAFRKHQLYLELSVVKGCALRNLTKVLQFITKRPLSGRYLPFTHPR